MSWIYLNHTLGPTTPLYGGASDLKIERPRQIDNGDTSNNSFLHFAAHSGTHIDAPWHFSAGGSALDELDASTWIFDNVHIIDLELAPETIITLETLGSHIETIPENCELLLLKSGFEKFRGNSDQYIFNGPGFSPEVGIYLRTKTNIRAIGFDFISLTSYQNRELGRIAHRAFLADVPDNESESFNEAPILIIEDMRLNELPKQLKKVMVAPLLFEKADGAPVTVLGEI